MTDSLPNGSVPDEPKQPDPGSPDWCRAERLGHINWLANLAKKAFDQVEFYQALEATKLREQYLRDIEREFNVKVT